MTSGGQFSRHYIPDFTSSEYAAAVELTRTRGSKARYAAPVLDAQASWEKRTAMLWAQKGLSPSGVKVTTGTTTPPGQWLKVAREMAATRNDDLLENARLMALVSLAEADAAIAAWQMKFDPQNNLWRPIHAIRLAAEPGDPFYNAGVTRDEAWSPLIPTSNHPEYVSGHSTFSGAAAQLLTHYFGADVSFNVAGDDALWLDAAGNIVDSSAPGATKEVRTYTSFWDAANEAGMSRIYGGIHYSFSNSSGLAAGSDIGDWIFSTALQPTVVPEPTLLLSLAPIGAAMASRHRRVRRA
jgi:membrane-associated phospholipid phosphatase